MKVKKIRDEIRELHGQTALVDDRKAFAVE